MRGEAGVPVVSDEADDPSGAGEDASLTGGRSRQ